jgi:hypothetical protein
MTEQARESVRTGSPDGTRTPSAPVPARAGHTPAAEHELFAVAGRRGMEPPRQIEVGRTDDPQEREADRVAELALRMSPSGPPSRTSRGTAGPGHGVAPPIVHDVLGSPGTPLAGTTRAFFEPRLGFDLSGVRVHQDAKAAASARAVDAAAYTVGTDIVFADGRYAPSTSAGQRLLAHELAHVIQQRVPPEGSGRVDGGVDRELVRQDDAVSFDEAPGVSAAIPRLQRQDVPVADRAAPVPTVSADRVDPVPAIDALTAWGKKGGTLLDGTAAWETHNFRLFLRRTSQNPHLGFADSAIAGIASNALGNLLTELGADMIKVGAAGLAQGSARILGALIGTAAGPGPGTVMGFLLGVIIESGASILFEDFTGKTDPDIAAADAVERAGSLIDAMEVAIDAKTMEAKADMDAMLQDKRAIVDAATTQAEVDAIKAWADEEFECTDDPPQVADDSLYKELLKHWVLEHAADTSTAAGDTSQEQWERATAEVFGTSNYLFFGALRSHPEIFVHQTRGQLAEIGIDHEAQTSALLAKVNELAAEAEDPAGAVAAYFHNKTFTFTDTPDPERVISYLARRWRPFDAWYVDSLREKKFRLHCTLDISSWQGSCYIDEWNFSIEFTSEKPKPALMWRSLSFDVSPDDVPSRDSGQRR